MSILELDTINRSWKQCTALGDKFYGKDKFELAKPHYINALYYGELIIRDADNLHHSSISISSPFTVACVKLANIFWKLGDLQKAAHYFFYNVWHLKILSKNKDAAELVQIEAKKEWRKAVFALINFYETTGLTLQLNFWDDKTYEEIASIRNVIIERKTRLN